MRSLRVIYLDLFLFWDFDLLFFTILARLGLGQWSHKTATKTAKFDGYRPWTWRLVGISCVLETSTNPAKAVMAKDSIRIEDMMRTRNQRLWVTWSNQREMEQRGGMSLLCIFCRALSFPPRVHRSAPGGEVRRFSNRTVSGEGHLKEKSLPRVEASTSIRASILLVFQQ